MSEFKTTLVEWLDKFIAYEIKDLTGLFSYAKLKEILWSTDFPIMYMKKVVYKENNFRKTYFK